MAPAGATDFVACGPAGAMRAPRLRAERGRGRRNARGLPRGTPYAIAGMRRGWPSSQSAIARFSTFQMMPLMNAA